MNNKNESRKVALFTNGFTPFKKEIKEYVNRIVFGKGTLFCWIFSIMAIVFGLLFGGLVLAIALAAICTAFLSLHITKHSKFKEAMKAFENLVSTGYEGWRSVFFDDMFESDNNTYYYEQISKVVKGKLCLHIIIEKKLLVMVKKDAFTKGDYESFVLFLREKLKDNPEALKGLR